MSEQSLQGAGARRELIAFHVGEELFCVDIMSVREIRGWTPATPLPHTPPYVKGVINLRGAVLPIIDLAARLGLPPTAEPSARHVIVVVMIANRTVGLLVDAVSDIINLTDDQLQPTPDIACDQVKTFVKGLFAVDDRMVSLIALDRVLPEVEAEAA